ncbi:MAG: RNA polymerase sigma factor [Patescibacteria group bacterium]
MEQQQINDALAKVQAGDTAAFGPVYDAYIERIYRFVYYKTHHRPTAEDLTADIFMKAFAKIATFDSVKGSFNGWIYQIARRTIIDHYRSDRPTINIEDAWDLAADSDTARDADAAIMVDKLREHLGTLTADQRDIVVLRVWEGLSHREIAEALGKSEASCKMAYSRATKNLQDSMGLAALILFLLSVR